MNLLLLTCYLLLTQPSLELEEVVIYGKRAVSLEIIKKDLIPDTVDTFPEFRKYSISLTRQGYKETHPYRSSLFNTSLCIGGSGTFSLFYGKDSFYTKVLYFNEANRPDHEFRISTVVTYKDFLFKGGFDLFDYKSPEYKKGFFTLGYTKSPYFASSFKTIIGEFDEKMEKAFIFKNSLLIPFKSMSSITSLELAQDEKFLGSIQEVLKFNLRRFSVEPGIKFYSESPYFAPYLGVKYYPFSIEYTQRMSLRTRDENLGENPYLIDNKPEIWDYGNCFTGSIQLTVDSRQSTVFEVEGGWTEKYPSFNGGEVDTISLSWVALCYKISYFGFMTKYNFSKPFYVPELEISVNFGYKGFSSGIKYSYIKDYDILSASVKYEFLSSVSVFIKGNNLLDNKVEIFKNYPERERKIYIGVGVKI